jgi:RNA recognition motif-containing protein
MGLIISNPEEQNQGDNLHVSGLARNISEQALTDLFNQYAKVSCLSRIYINVRGS